jgi:predicted TIM-barrel fold metal-dependent hydrolase
MQIKTNEESNSTPFRGLWTRRAFCKSWGLGGLASALPAYALAQTQPWGCVESTSAPHQRIDAHVHIFNGTDLQIAGFLKEPVANEFPKIRELLSLIADPLQDFVWSVSPKANDELRILNQVVDKTGARAFSVQEFGSVLQSHRAETQAQYNEFLRQQLRREEVRRELQKMIKPGKNSHRTIQELDRVPATGTERDLARRVDQYSGIPVFDFLEPFFSYRYSNFFELVEQFTCANASPIDTFVALLVDYDVTLGDPSGAPTPSTIDEQTEVTSRICELSRGHLIALAPYCPLKDVALKNASLANVLKAWKRRGFVGAKMYPPMGFYPSGNTGKNGQAIDKALAQLYHECVSSDAVVLAHAGPSWCAKSGKCEYPGPKGWAGAINGVFDTERKPLRAALGHFGGPFDKKRPEARIWPEEFIDLMKEPAGEKLYADLSYASEILQPSNDKPVVKRLTGLMKRSSPLLSERLMYGSDWLLLGLESQWRSYEKRMEFIIDKTEKASGATGLKGRFFGHNARDWLGLDDPMSLASRNTAGL